MGFALTLNVSRHASEAKRTSIKQRIKDYFVSPRSLTLFVVPEHPPKTGLKIQTNLTNFYGTYFICENAIYQYLR